MTIKPDKSPDNRKYNATFERYKATHVKVTRFCDVQRNLKDQMLRSLGTYIVDTLLDPVERSQIQPILSSSLHSSMGNSLMAILQTFASKQAATEITVSSRPLLYMPVPHLDSYISRISYSRYLGIYGFKVQNLDIQIPRYLCRYLGIQCSRYLASCLLYAFNHSHTNQPFYLPVMLTPQQLPTWIQSKISHLPPCLAAHCQITLPAAEYFLVCPQGYVTSPEHT